MRTLLLNLSRMWCHGVVGWAVRGDTRLQNLQAHLLRVLSFRYAAPAMPHTIVQTLAFLFCGRR